MIPSVLRVGRCGLAAGAILVAIAPGVGAAPIRYVTQGILDAGPDRPGASPAGSQAVRFEGAEGQLDGPAPFRLGTFVVSAPPVGAESRYDHTPFRIELRLPDLDRSLPAGAPDGHPDLRTVIDHSVIVAGHLDGAVRPDGTGDLTATVAGVRLGGLRLATADHARRYAFPVPTADLRVEVPRRLALPADPGDGRTDLDARLVPEPATIALFLSTLAGLALRRRMQRDRPAF